MIRRSAAFVAALVLIAFLPAFAQNKTDSPPAYDVREHYTKYEYAIPMRDGVKLFTAVYVPKEISRTFPFLMDRTPYSVAPYGVDNYRTSLGPSEAFERAGYIFVYQDVRGRICRRAHFWRCDRTSTTKRRRTTSTTAPTRTTRSSGC